MGKLNTEEFFYDQSERHFPPWNPGFIALSGTTEKVCRGNALRRCGIHRNFSRQFRRHEKNHDRSIAIQTEMRLILSRFAFTIVFMGGIKC